LHAARDNDVRERLGPIIARLKASVATIQALEGSRKIQGVENINRKSEGNGKGKGTKSNGGKDRDLGRHQPLAIIDCNPTQRRQFVHQSMESVREKMFRLKNMEEELATLENRGEHLRHMALQTTQRAHDCCSNGNANANGNKETSPRNRNETLLSGGGNSISLSISKTRNAVLPEKTSDAERSEMEKDPGNETMLRRKLEITIERQEHELDASRARCHHLEGTVEHLRNTCDTLVRALREQEQRSHRLEVELKLVVQAKGLRSECDFLLDHGKQHEKQQEQKQERNGSNCNCNCNCNCNYNCNESLALTEPLALSWTTDSSLTNEMILFDHETSIIDVTEDPAANGYGNHSHSACDVGNEP